MYTFSLLYQLRNHTLVPTNSSSPQISVSNTISHERNQGALEKWLNVGFRQEIYKVSPSLL